MIARKLLTLVAAMVAALAAHAADDVTPRLDTVRVYGTGEVDMVWTFVLEDDDASGELRILVSGCAAGSGELTFVDDLGARESDEIVEWSKDGDQLADHVARVTCQAAGQS